MCFLALLYRQVTNHPIVLAANRDERPDRRGLPPQELRAGVFGGKDPLHGGTWLATNARGGLAAIANRRVDAAATDPHARSRGLLCLAIAGQPGPATMKETLIEALADDPYPPFNLMFGDATDMRIASWDGEALETAPVEPGVHVLGNQRLNEPTDPKVVRGQRLLTPCDQLRPALDMLLAACRDHGERADGRDTICVHRGPSPTLSCSVLALHADGGDGSLYLHAGGRPCETVLLDHSAVLRGSAF